MATAQAIARKSESTVTARTDGYLPIEDHAALGDGRGLALVALTQLAPINAATMFDHGAAAGPR